MQPSATEAASAVHKGIHTALKPQNNDTAIVLIFALPADSPASTTATEWGNLVGTIPKGAALAWRLGKHFINEPTPGAIWHDLSIVVLCNVPGAATITKWKSRNHFERLSALMEHYNGHLDDDISTLTTVQDIQHEEFEPYPPENYPKGPEHVIPECGRPNSVEALRQSSNYRTYANTAAAPCGLVTVGTDGSEIDGAAGFGVFLHPNHIIRGRVPGRQTSGRGEMGAILRALQVVPIDSQLHIYTDCLTAIDKITRWLNPMTKGNPDRIPDAPLILEIIDLLLTRPAITRIFKIKAHAGHAINECADILAKNGNEHEADYESWPTEDAQLCSVYSAITEDEVYDTKKSITKFDNNKLKNEFLNPIHKQGKFIQNKLLNNEESMHYVKASSLSDKECNATL